MKIETVEIAKTYSDKYVRNWYDSKVRSLNTNVTFTEENARALTEQRNAIKIEARKMMGNAQGAAELNETRPIMSFEHYVERYTKQGYSGTALWQRIIQGSSTPNQNVNQKFGVDKNYYYGQ